jgi:hypothetical protein
MFRELYTFISSSLQLYFLKACATRLSEIRDAVRSLVAMAQWFLIRCAARCMHKAAMMQTSGKQTSLHDDASCG